MKQCYWGFNLKTIGATQLNVEDLEGGKTYNVPLVRETRVVKLKAHSFMRILEELNADLSRFETIWLAEIWLEEIAAEWSRLD